MAAILTRTFLGSKSLFYWKIKYTIIKVADNIILHIADKRTVRIERVVHDGDDDTIIIMLVFSLPPLPRAKCKKSRATIKEISPSIASNNIIIYACTAAYPKCEVRRPRGNGRRFNDIIRRRAEHVTANKSSKHALDEQWLPGSGVIITRRERTFFSLYSSFRLYIILLWSK